MNTFVFTANSDQGMGWSLVALAALAVRFGWAIGLAALVAAFSLRKSKHPAMGLLLVLLLSGGSLLLAVSLGLMVGFANTPPQGPNGHDRDASHPAGGMTPPGLALPPNRVFIAHPHHEPEPNRQAAPQNRRDGH